MKKRFKIDERIDNQIERVAARMGIFSITEVQNFVLSDPGLVSAFINMDRAYHGWDFPALITRYIERKIGERLRAKDRNGIRRYECYSNGGAAFRWTRFATLDIPSLRLVIGSTTSQERALATKRRVYQLFLAGMEALGANAKAGDVYDETVAKINKRA